MAANNEEEKPLLTPEQQARIEKAAKQLIGCATFLKWTLAYPKNSIDAHSNSSKIKLLSVVQSGCFAFSLQDETLFLGVQDMERGWFNVMPFSFAVLSDRLYLLVDSVQCLGKKIPALGLGIFVDNDWKIEQLKKANKIQFISIKAEEGEVIEVGKTFGDEVDLYHEDVIQFLKARTEQGVSDLDLNRLF